MTTRSYKSSFAETAIAILAVGGLALSSSLHAADGRTQENAGETVTSLETVIVTAQKRAQAVGDVGITINVVSAAQLSALGVTDPTQLSKAVPGFTAAVDEGGYPVYSIRGIGYNANQLSALPTVSTYIDEAPLSYPAMTTGMLFDLERIEVSKGPQGTLFGQNSTAGAVDFIAAKPTKEFSAAANATASSYGQSQLEGYVSGPLTDTLRARFAVDSIQGGDWQRSWTRDASHGATRRTAGRFLLDFVPNDVFKIALNLNGFSDRSDTQVNQLSSLAIANPANAAPGLATYPTPPRSDRAADWDPNIGASNAYGLIGPYAADNTFGQGVLRFDWQVSSGVKLVAITDYSHLTYNELHDIDGTSIRVVNSRALGDIRSFSQEVRASGDVADGAISYIAGVNYQDDKIDEQTQYDHYQYSGLPRGFSLNPFADTKYTTTGYFGDVDWKLSRKLSATAGLRYTKVKQSFVGCTRDAGDGSGAGFFGGVANALRGANGLGPTSTYVPGGCFTVGPAPTFLPYLGNLSSNDSNVSWRAGLNFKPNDDTLLYALASRGYKAGGFFLGVAIFSNSVNRVQQEELTSYEVGAKATIGHRATVNFSLFDYVYGNKQFYTYESDPLVGTLAILANIPHSTARGADLDLVVALARGLKVRLGATYSSTEVGNYLGLEPGVGTINFKGNRFNYAPLLSGTADVSYTIPVTKGISGFMGFGLLYNSQTYGDLGESAVLRIPAYAVLDGRVGIQSDAGWQITAWGRNLTNKYYWTNALIGADADYRTMGLPSWYGVTVGYQF